MIHEKTKREEPRAIIIAEAGINHDGDIQKALKMIDVAAEAGADYCKFQTFNADKLVIPVSPTSSYIDEGSHKGETFRELLYRLELSKEDHLILKEYCGNSGIKFLSTPFNEKNFDFLLELGIDIAKVASGNLTNIPFLRHMAASKLPMYVSTGMAKLGEIEEAISAINKEGNDNIFLFHCISWYPAEIDTANLRFMNTLKNAFGYPVGFSDHTLGINMSIAARAMGALSIEKHFTLNRNDFGPDHKASIDPQELKNLVKGIKEVERGLGQSYREFGEKEINQRNVHRTSIIVNCEITKGDTFSTENLTIKRPGTGIEPKFLYDIIGKKSKLDLSSETILAWKHIE